MTGRLRHDALVLVPGLVCDRDLFEPQVSALSPDIEVAVADVSGGASIGEMAEAVLDLAAGPFALAGLSMGGYVCWEVLRRAPDRVTALALLDTSARPDTPEATARRRELIESARRRGYEEVFDAMWPLAVAPSRVGDDALRDRFWRMTSAYGEQVYCRHQEAIIARADSRPDMPRVAVPTLVLCGRSDAITPLDGHVEMAAGIDGCDLVVLGDCGHLSTWERPADVTAAMRAWLARAP